MKIKVSYSEGRTTVEVDEGDKTYRGAADGPPDGAEASKVIDVACIYVRDVLHQEPEVEVPSAAAI